jgi:hypothetical protein
MSERKTYAEKINEKNKAERYGFPDLPRELEAVDVLHIINYHQEVLSLALNLLEDLQLDNDGYCRECGRGQELNCTKTCKFSQAITKIKVLTSSKG